MDGICNLFQSISETKQIFLPKFTQAFDEHQTFQYNASSTTNDSIAGHINSLLNSGETRYEGLVLLHAFLAQCPPDLLENKGVIWITLCTKICNAKSPANGVPIAYDILNEIITKSVDSNELSKSLSGSLLSKIIESTSSQPISCGIAILSIFETSLRCYPGPCAASRSIIQKQTNRFIDCHDDVIVRAAGRCLHLLQQIRGGGVQGISHKNLWLQYQMQVLGSLHECLDAMFSNTQEKFDGSTIEDLLDVPKLNLSYEPTEKAVQLILRCGNFVRFLEIMIVEPFPVSKSIHVTKILNLIERGLEVNCQTLSKNAILDNLSLGALLPELHVKLFDLLNSLILILGSNLLIYSRQILQMILQSLKWTNTGRAFGSKRPYISVRIAAYRSLINWCKMAKYGSTVEKCSEHLIADILNDITPFQNEVTLKVMPGARKQLSKKARKRLHTAQNNASNISKVHSHTAGTKNIFNDVGNENLCTIALDCLSEIIIVAGPLIKATIHRLLQESITVINATSLRNNLYDFVECRLSLFRGLYNLVICPHHLIPPPLQYALSIFSVSQVRDKSVRVRTICSEYMRGFEKILHPQKQYLHFEIELGEVEKVLRLEKSSTISQNGDVCRNPIEVTTNDSIQNDDSSEDEMVLHMSQSSIETIEFIPPNDLNSFYESKPLGSREENTVADVEDKIQLKEKMETIELDSDKDEIHEILDDDDPVLINSVNEPPRKRNKTVSINLCDDNTATPHEYKKLTTAENGHADQIVVDVTQDEDEILKQLEAEFTNELNE